MQLCFESTQPTEIHFNQVIANYSFGSGIPYYTNLVCLPWAFYMCVVIYLCVVAAAAAADRVHYHYFGFY